MEETQTYENFPAWIPAVCTLLTMSIYAIGAIILGRFGILWAGLYLAYCLWIEFRVLKESCVDCTYYGKRCGLGRGRLCALLFREGDPSRFAEKNATWAAMVPDFLVPLIPLVGGVILLLTRGFSWSLVILLVLLVVLYFGGNAVARGALACRYCRQRELGCPAEKLFQTTTD